MAALKRYEDRVADRRIELERGIERVRAFTQEQPWIDAVYVTGSYARKEIGPTSDLDLIFVFASDETPLDRARRIIRGLRLDLAVDVWCFTPEEWASDEALSLFGKSLRATAVPLDAI